MRLYNEFYFNKISSGRAYFITISRIQIRKTVEISEKDANTITFQILFQFVNTEPN